MKYYNLLSKILLKYNKGEIGTIEATSRIRYHDSRGRS